jgi:hypothetical protein
LQIDSVLVLWLFDKPSATHRPRFLHHPQGADKKFPPPPHAGVYWRKRRALVDSSIARNRIGIPIAVDSVSSDPLDVPYYSFGKSGI